MAASKKDQNVEATVNIYKDTVVQLVHAPSCSSTKKKVCLRSKSFLSC